MQITTSGGSAVFSASRIDAAAGLLLFLRFSAVCCYISYTYAEVGNVSDFGQIFGHSSPAPKEQFPFYYQGFMSLLASSYAQRKGTQTRMFSKTKRPLRASTLTARNH